MSTATSPVIDRVVDGRYRVESLLARGGMASVYQATDLRLERRVALKVMHPDLARDEQFVARFRREARSAARLSHPNVVAVYDQGEDGDLVFLAMELVQGRTLREVIHHDAPLTAREAIALIDPVLLALAAAHDAGLVHRDIKPENVLLHPSGAIKVADFGLARAITATTVSRSNDLTWGTAAYLSPEQVERGSADARSDVYAAGLLLFEVLTGAKAFPGSSPIQVAYQHVHGQVPRVADLVPTVPAELDALVQWAGAKDPADRPADAGELRRELQHALAQLSDEELDAVPGRAVVTDPDATRQFERTTSFPADHTAGVPYAGADGHFARTKGNRSARSRPAPSPVSRPRRRRRVIGWVLGLLMLLIGVGAAGATWYYAAGPGIHSPVPGLAGLAEADAQRALDVAELDAVSVPTYSEEVPAGEVVAASHQPGAVLRHGTDVELTVSQGPERYAVPELTGRSLEEARGLVEEANLALGEPTEQFDEEVPQGLVLSVRPVPGEPVRPGTTVEVVVSAGREPIEVPGVTGRPEAEAEQALTGAGFTVSVASEQAFDDQVPAGSVVSQDPGEGSAFRGDTVTLVISQGPELVEVPQVIGMQWEQAESTLSEMGLEVAREDLAGGYFNTVRFQSVEPGESVPKGTEVVLTVL